jgi:hypothetical protein
MAAYFSLPKSDISDNLRHIRSRRKVDPKWRGAYRSE